MKFKLCKRLIKGKRRKMSSLEKDKEKETTIYIILMVYLKKKKTGTHTELIKKERQIDKQERLSGRNTKFEA